MNAEQKQIHERALLAKKQFHNFELGFVEILQDAERTKVPKAAGKKTLHDYAVEVLGFTDAVAYLYIAVARKAKEVPEISEANLSVFVLTRLVSTINSKNAAGRRNPRYKPEKTKIHSEECVELTLKVSKDFLDKLKRAQSLLAQKNVESGMGSALEASLDEYLRRHDPVQKAERAQTKKQSAEPVKFCAHRKRKPLTAAQKHAVFLRDQGKCTHVDESGHRCGSDRWVHIHHIIEVARGGSNEPENLTTLCSFHHDQTHSATG